MSNTGALDFKAAHGRLARVAARLDPAKPVPSPCISVCRMDLVGVSCEGCLRTLDEIAAWSRLNDADKRGVWSQIALRAQRMTRAHTPGAHPPGAERPGTEA